MVRWYIRTLNGYTGLKRELRSDYMNWYMEYRGVESLTAEDKRFLSSFNSCKEFEDYCFLNISEDWFLSNGNITFDMVLKELRNEQL